MAIADNDPFAQFKAAQREGWALFVPLEAFTTPAAARLVDFARVIGVPTANVRFSALWAKLAVKSFEGIAMNTKLSKLPVDECIKLVEELHGSLRQVIDESGRAPWPNIVTP